MILILYFAFDEWIIMDYLVFQLLTRWFLSCTCVRFESSWIIWCLIYEVLQKVFDCAAATNTDLVIFDVLTTEQTKSTTQVLAMWTKLIVSLAVVYETAVSCSADDSAAIQAVDEQGFGDQAQRHPAVSERLHACELIGIRVCHACSNMCVCVFCFVCLLFIYLYMHSYPCR